MTEPRGAGAGVGSAASTTPVEQKSSSVDDDWTDDDADDSSSGLDRISFLCFHAKGGDR